ncbi:Calcium-transporting ATPase [Heracleum sosnowskyi]|uniref:Calcium-transporting ATPase n=1 Tax=Heracleum sosnowskyi TaxID=360622 RepID=A0AAD8JFA5_9APIA|nr:Calcium-transporting ATPase [Heracleum sosnowskyi]
MSEANPNIDYEAQSLLVFTPDSSPRHIWTRIIVLLHSISKFKSEAERSYTSIDGPNDEGQSEITVVVDGSSSTYDGLIKIGSAQEDSVSSIKDGLTSKVTSQALRDNSHHGIELLSQSNIGEISVSTPTASQNASTVQFVLPKSHQDRLQRSQTKKITQIIKDKDLKSFQSFGGIKGVADALSSDLVKGLYDKDDIHQRKMKIYFQNQLPKSCFVSLLIDTCKSFGIILLLVVAALSLGFGLKEEGTDTGWLDGAILFLMITVLVLFTSSCNYYHKRNLLKKSRKLDVPEETVHVTRGECNKSISISDLVHGDIVLLERGYKVPCDGFFIDGKSLEVDSGSETIIDDNSPFLFYGSRVINGSGRMIVASVGSNTVWSELMRTKSRDKKSKVEVHLHKLLKTIHIAGLLLTILTFIATFLRFVLKKQDDANGYRSEVKDEPTAIRVICNTFEKIITEPKGTARTLTYLLSVSLVGIMDNMPMVVSIAITLWNNKVLSDKVTCHDLLACVKSSSVTRICTDNIGGLTEHLMEVKMVSVDCDVIRDSSSLSPKVLEVLCEGIGTSVLTSADACNAMPASLCLWANDAIGLMSNNLKTNWELLQRTESVPCINPCGVLIKKAEEDDMCLHWKGPVTEILADCSRYYDKEGNLLRLNSQKKLAFEGVYKDMLDKKLKTVALACRPGVVHGLERNDLDLIGLIGLKDSGKEKTKEAIKSAFKGGVKTILVSADDVSSLKHIAVEHGLLNQTSDLVLKSEEFHELTKTERMEKIDRICVLGNCLPADKQFFVKCLRDRGEVVAMVGMQTNDAPALKESDIGVAMGTWNSEVARECSDITIWNEGLYFFFDVICCGRCVYGKLQKFIQVLLIMTVSSPLINFFGVIFTGDSPMTAIQLFGLNLFMTFIDGMALLGSPLARRQDNEFTVGPTGPLLNMAMTRNVIAQLSYQIIILVTLQQKWHLIEGITQESIPSMIFNSLIICQVFNLFCARELQKKNFFKGIHHDLWFWCALAIYILLHTLFVAIGYRLARDARLNYKLWAGCFLIGIISWLVDWISKLVLPSSMIECFTGKCKITIFKKDWWLGKSGCLHSESLPPEINSNLHDPLINTSESVSTQRQNEALE